ncbi:MAG: translational GTPase TypA [Ruminococcaceae bacterium]|nr:translational GTPase TypA [Oscillospiraceae bacterium]
MSQRENLRNVAIIAHVDHGKTTLVDGMLRQSGIFRENQQVDERVMDNNDLEKERGITILSKNTSLMYNDIRINIVDTPGHADFGGEVERVLKMVDGVLVLVDSFEGCMPQTRFVLKKALSLNLKPIIVVNKIDRPNARPYDVVDEVLELFLELEATDDQFNSPVVYASGRDGYATMNPEKPGEDLKPLLDMIVNHVPAPQGDENAPLQLLISNIDYDEYVGPIAVGRVERGRAKVGQNAVVCKKDGSVQQIRLTKMFMYDGLKRVEAAEATIGDIVQVSGVADVKIGETICDSDNPEPLPFIDIDEPTISMNFSVNNSPFAGREGEFVTSRHLRDRLFKEMATNVSLKVEETDSAETFKVSGRGELHLSVLIETMRRQGYEFQVSKPQVINKIIDGKVMEPMELLMIDVPDEYTGTVIQTLSERKAQLINMNASNSGFTRIEFNIPSRSLIGYRSQLMTDTRGNGIMNHVLTGYEEFKGEIPVRARGSLVAFEDGETVTYGLFNAQERGSLFIGPGEKVYMGMVVGENNRGGDIDVNVCKKKHVTNMRASGSDEALRLVPPVIMSLENCIEFLADDELLEVTPTSLRIRKMILDKTLRAKANSRK